MTDDAVLHALVDLVQALDQQNIILVNCPAYENAYKVLRDNVRIKQPAGIRIPTDREVKSLAKAAGLARYVWDTDTAIMDLARFAHMAATHLTSPIPQPERE